MANILLISTKTLKAKSYIEENVDDKTLSKIVLNVQEGELKQVLGKELYNSVCNEVALKATDSTHVIPTVIKDLLEDYIQPYLTYATCAEFIVVNNYKLSNKGVQKLNDNSSSSTSQNEGEYLKNYYDNYVVTYKSNLIKYLRENNLNVAGTDNNLSFPATGWYFGNSKHCGSTTPSPSPNIPSTADLQTVTDAGNTTTNNIEVINGDDAVITSGEEIAFKKGEHTVSIKAANIHTNYSVVLPEYAEGGSANLPLTVNGVPADGVGNIEIDLAGASYQDLQSVTDWGNTTANDIIIQSDNISLSVVSQNGEGTARIGIDADAMPFIELAKNAAEETIQLRIDNIDGGKTIQFPNISDPVGTLVATVNGIPADANGNVVVEAGGGEYPITKLEGGDTLDLDNALSKMKYVCNQNTVSVNLQDITYTNLSNQVKTLNELLQTQTTNDFVITVDVVTDIREDGNKFLYVTQTITTAEEKNNFQRNRWLWYDSEDNLLMQTGKEFYPLDDVDTNFANTDLVASGSRVHDFTGNNLEFANVNVLIAGEATNIVQYPAGDSYALTVPYNYTYIIIDFSDDVSMGIDTLRTVRLEDNKGHIDDYTFQWGNLGAEGEGLEDYRWFCMPETLSDSYTLLFYTQVELGKSSLSIDADVVEYDDANMLAVFAGNKIVKSNGGFVSLEGTTLSKPITGNLVFANEDSNTQFLKAGNRSIAFTDDGLLTLTNINEPSATKMEFSTDYIGISARIYNPDISANQYGGLNIGSGGLELFTSSTTSDGLRGNIYFGNNAGDTSFIQKRYLDENALTYSGTVDGKFIGNYLDVSSSGGFRAHNTIANHYSYFIANTSNDLTWQLTNFNAGGYENTVTLTPTSLFITGSSPAANFVGISAAQDFSSINPTNKFVYAQRQYVDNIALPYTGTGFMKYLTGTYAVRNNSFSIQSSFTGTSVTNQNGLAFYNDSIVLSTGNGTRTASLILTDVETVLGVDNVAGNVKLAVNGASSLSAGIQIIDSRAGSRGLQSSFDFTPNITALDFTQRKFVDAGLALKADKNTNFTTVTSTAYTLLSTDNGKTIICDNAATITITVPASLGAGFNIQILQKGAGVVTFTGSGSTVTNRQGFYSTAGTMSVAGLIAYEANNFVLCGDLQA